MTPEEVVNALFSAEDNEYIKKAIHSPIFSDIYPEIDFLSNSIYQIKRGLSYIIADKYFSILKEENEESVVKVQNILTNLDLIENNLEALITEVDGTSNFVGDKSSVILNYWFSKNIKAIKFNFEFTDKFSYAKTKSDITLDEWAEYLDNYLDLIQSTMFSKNVFRKYNDSLNVILNKKHPKS